MPTVNIKTVKKCAFCKYWHDPTNSAIFPRSPKINLWEYNEKAKMKCLQKNYDMKASAFCGKFECKLEVIGRQQHDNGSFGKKKDNKKSGHEELDSES